MKLFRKECAFRGCLESYCLTASRRKRKDATIFVACAVEKLTILMQQSIEHHQSFKMQICLKVKLKKMDTAQTTNYFNCKQIIVLPGDDFEELLINPLAGILLQVDEFQEKGSGWIFNEVKQMDVHIAKYQPLRGSTFVQLPNYIRNKRAVVNVQNNDNKCFVWAILSALYPVNRSSHRRMNYIQHLEDISWMEFQMPMKVQDIAKFEDKNELSINVYDFKESNFAPLRISKFKHERCINLLYYENHYCWIKSLDRLLRDQNKHNGKHFCPCCIFPLRSKEAMEKHFMACRNGNHTRITMPSSDDNILEFKNVHRQLEAPMIIYADFECLTEVVEKQNTELDEDMSYTRTYQKHTPCGYALLPVIRSGIKESEYKHLTLYRGEDTMKHFLNKILTIAEDHHSSMKQPLDMQKEDWTKFYSAKFCLICSTILGTDRVRDHCHVSGKFRGAAHSKCNIALRLNRDVSVGIHNLRRYDGHIIMNQLGTLCEAHPQLEINAIAKNMEDYLSFSLKLTCYTGKRRHDGTAATSSFRIRFIDTCQFLPSTLESLAGNLKTEHFIAMQKHFSQDELSKLRRKQIYPYDYMSTWERFKETQLPTQKQFYNILTRSNLSDEDYKHAHEIWKSFNISNLGEYHDLYLTTDVLLLTDVFENFRTTALYNYGLDPVHYITLPSYALDAMLKSNRERRPELLTDPDMYAFFENGSRGGISVIGHRHALANNPYLKDYNENNPTTYNIYLDVNNLYGTAMMEKLPYSDFKWLEIAEMNNLDVTSISDDSETGYVLEVDLEYPEDLHDIHNAYPMAPERIIIKDEWLSEYALKHKTSKAKVEKLVPNLMNKTKYIVHYRNLKLYLKHGMKLKTIHRGIQFHQTAWMKVYIEFNTMMRRDSKNAFEKDFFKLMNNAVFGKTMENVRNYRDVKLLSQVKHKEKYLKLVADPRFLEAKVFSNDLVAIHMMQRTTNLNKPIYTGMSILDLSKIYMYAFHYEYIIPKYDYKNVRLLMTDTDSFIYNISTNDLYSDMLNEAERFDFSDYPKNHALYSDKNKKVLGKMKDETCGRPIREFVGLRAKMYSILCDDEKEMKRAKGVQKATLAAEISHNNYRQTLTLGATQRNLMHSIRSKNHEIFSIEQNKISLCPFDDKRYLLSDGINSYAYGHKNISNR